VHTSAVSQAPAAARHVVPAAANVSAGQKALLPVHASAVSQAPAAARHVVPAATKTSGGQDVDTPLQTSAASQTPADARHSVPAGAGPTATQTGIPLPQSICPSSHALPVAQGAPALQPSAHMPALSQLPPVHGVPGG
jgi:hypothetical protein